MFLYLMTVREFTMAGGWDADDRRACRYICRKIPDGIGLRIITVLSDVGRMPGIE
jgi:hypothetical protein